MKHKNLLESIIDEQIESKRLQEISQLVKEYDSLDSMLIENKSYDRDVQIVVRLDELGVFDSILERQTPEEVARRKKAAALEAEKRRLQQSYKDDGIPDDIAQRAVEKDISNFGKSYDAERAIKKRTPAEFSRPEKRTPVESPVTTPQKKSGTESGKLSRLFGKGKDGLARAGKMLATAVKSGNTQLVSKIKAAINKVRGKKPNAPVSDVPGVSKDVAAQVNDTPAQASGEPDLFGGTSTPEPVKGDTTEPEAPTSAPSDPDQMDLDFDTPAEEPKDEPAAKKPAAEEPKDTVSPETKDRLQTLAGVKPEEPAPTPTKPTATADEPKAAETPKEEPAAEEPKIVPPPPPPPASPKGAKSSKTVPPPPPPPSSPSKTVPPPPPPPSSPSSTLDEPKRLIPKPAPVMAPDEPKRLIPKSEPVKSEPAKPSEPEPAAPEKAQPWSAKGREAKSKELAAMSPEERARQKEKSMGRLGFAPGERSFLDRVRSAGRAAKTAFTAPAGTSATIQTEPVKWKSRFAEVLQMMEELQQIEHQLHELSLAEGLVGGQKNLDRDGDGRLTAKDFRMLRAHRKHLREALVKEMIREELEKHNTTLAELNPRQRTALMEYVTKRSTKMWEMMAEARISDKT